MPTSASTSSRRIVAVVGATGEQGGSVVTALLAHPEKYAVRALTRNPTSERAKELAARGADLIKCDLDMPADLARAFAGAHVVFAMTNFWEPSSLARGDLDFELRQGKHMANAAKNAGVEHFIWSSLPNADAISGGKFNCHHFTNKGKIEAYIREIDLSATFVYAGFYMSNIQSFFAPTRLSDGSYEWSTPIHPDVSLPLCDAGSDMGHVVQKILTSPIADVKGKRYAVSADEYLTFPQICGVFEKVTGIKSSYRHVPLTDEMRKAAMDKCDEVTLSTYAMFDFINVHGYWGGLNKEPGWCQIEDGHGLRWTTWAKFLHKTTLRLEGF